MNKPLAVRLDRPVRSRGWMLATVAFVVAVMVLLICYWRTVESLVSVWAHDGTYQYAFLIFPVSLWVAFNLRHEVRAHPPRPSVWGVVAVVLLVGLWYVGHMLDVNLPQHFALVALFPALVLACWGWRALWTLVFPLAYLVVFAVPWGDSMVGPLQDITARFAVHALDLTGIPVLLNGREIITPTAVWMVEAACSGVKFFIACTALGCLYAYLMYQRWWKRVLFVVLAAVVPVIANGFRVYFTVLIGEHFGLKYATGTDHMVFGWQFFGTVLVLLLLVGWFFRDRYVPQKLPLPAADTAIGVRSVVWPVAIVLLLMGPVVAAALAVPTQTRTVHLSAPAVAGWQGPQAASELWRPSFKGASGELQVSYQSTKERGAVGLFHAVYAGKPQRGHNLITYGNDVYDPARVRLLSASDQQLVLATGRKMDVRELRVNSETGSRLVWYWYCVDHRCSRSPLVIKLWQAWDVLRGREARSSVWALSTHIDHRGKESARENLLAFARGLPATMAPTESTP